MQADSTRLVLFDAYGTLFDIASPVRESAARLGEKAAALVVLWRRKQLEYTWLRTLMGRYETFDRVTADALRFALASLGASNADLEARLLASYDGVRAYPDVSGTVAALAGMGIASGILSNGTPAMLASALEANGLAASFSHVLSVETAGRYKPDPAVYALASSESGLLEEAIVFVSANAWDVAGASSFGLRVVWLNRDGAPPEELPGTPIAVLSSLAELPPLLQG
jgi:2-haloacid dehalogenase